MELNVWTLMSWNVNCGCNFELIKISFANSNENIYVKYVRNFVGNLKNCWSFFCVCV